MDKEEKCEVRNLTCVTFPTKKQCRGIGVGGCVCKCHFKYRLDWLITNFMYILLIHIFTFLNHIYKQFRILHLKQLRSRYEKVVSNFYYHCSKDTIIGNVLFSSSGLLHCDNHHFLHRWRNRDRSVRLQKVWNWNVFF